MAKSGRLFVPLDVNWYDEWGYAVSTDAALLWVIALTTCKRMRTDGTLTISQLRRAAPVDWSDDLFTRALAELHRCDIAPMECDDRAIILRGWSSWHDSSLTTSLKSQSGSWGNHVRWHLKTETPSLSCTFCQSTEATLTVSQPIAPDIAQRSLIEKSREEKITIAPAMPALTVEGDFGQCWQHYPRKWARKAALKAYTAQRRKGRSAADLLRATQNFAEAMRRDGREQEHILYGATFFGPSDRWEDYLTDLEPEPTTSVALGAGRLDLSEYGEDLGERVRLPGEA
jgi:hypothetical protein